MSNTQTIREYLDASHAARAFAATLKVGDIVATAADFTSPIGCFFRKGHTFVVESVGEVNTRCRDTKTGSVVWLTSGVFAVAH